MRARLALLVLVVFCACTQEDTYEKPPEIVAMETEVRQAYNCSQAGYWGELETATGNYSVFECNVFDEAGELEGVYYIDRHPFGRGAVSYVLVGKSEIHVKNSGELMPIFGRIEKEGQALDYVALHEGLWWVEGLLWRDTEVRRTRDNWELSVLHSDRTMCPCYEIYYLSEYRLTDGGNLEKLGTKKVMDRSELGCRC